MGIPQKDTIPGRLLLNSVSSDDVPGWAIHYVEPIFTVRHRIVDNFNVLCLIFKIDHDIAFSHDIVLNFNAIRILIA